MATIDREVLRRRIAQEEETFVAMHPKSAQLAEEARRSMLTGVPMAWMTRWPGRF
ncbi:MAG: aspartate aminotransferase family protein, partial [Thermoleophilia bacterium]|nr:aspartate aminotransferase family protein [Thermoleophilia bacterium]